jgi:BirA family transcriptional regulator, biotin operon repressor / biotin---[acetyl-CoA-carboxylase] ligase
MLDPDANARLAGTRFPAVRWEAEVDSTNRVLLEEARGGAGEGTVLVADHQTAGRGRLGRTWTAPPGASLLVSVLLRPALAADELHLCTMAVGVAAAEACERVTGFLPALKWPNDLVVEQPDGTARKLGGILAESVVDGGRVTALVVGMGLNVTWPADLPADLADIATALNHEVGHDVDRAELLVTWLLALDHWYGELAPGAAEPGRERLRTRYRHLCATLGHRVRVEVPTGAIVGLARDVTAEGHLIVDADDGESFWVAVGDVVHLRPAG